MNALEIIRKKRDGLQLNPEEIRFFVRGVADKTIEDYHIAAFTMAVFFRGMSEEETVELTLAMAESGEKLDLSSIPGIKVDKHSTGGVGDKTTLVVVPMVAAAGVPVVKMSGRGLGFTGGTIDKLESIPGFRTDLTFEELVNQVKDIGAVLMAQSQNLVPADKRVYAIRDVTATVDSLPLIASSVMSKKIAMGADAIVLDVKVGQGALVKELDEAVKLASLMVKIGKKAGKDVVAVLSSMAQPLGWAVGNALEVKEALETLQGRGPEDLTYLSVLLASHMLVLGKKHANLAEAEEAAVDILARGLGYKKLVEIVEAQGGRAEVLEDLNRYQKASLQIVVKAPCSGFIRAIDSELIGRIVVKLGGGREKLNQRIDHAVGIVLRKKVGDWVDKEEALAVIHANDPYRLEAARRELLQAYQWQDDEPVCEPLVLGVVTEDGISLNA